MSRYPPHTIKELEEDVLMVYLLRSHLHIDSIETALEGSLLHIRGQLVDTTLSFAGFHVPIHPELSRWSNVHKNQFSKTIDLHVPVSLHPQGKHPAIDTHPEYISISLKRIRG